MPILLQPFGQAQREPTTDSPLPPARPNHRLRQPKQLTFSLDELQSQGVRFEDDPAPAPKTYSEADITASGAYFTDSPPPVAAPELRATPEVPLYKQAYNKVRESLSPLIGPTDAQRMRDSMLDVDGNVVYKPMASSAEREGLIPGIMGAKPSGDTMTTGLVKALGLPAVDPATGRIEQQDGKIMQTIAGTANAGLGLADSLQSPGSLLTLGLLGGLNTIGQSGKILQAGGNLSISDAVVANTAKALAQNAQRAASGAFAADMASHVPAGATALGEAAGSGNTQAAVESGVNTAANLGLMGMAAKHAATKAPIVAANEAVNRTVQAGLDRPASRAVLAEHSPELLTPDTPTIRYGKAEQVAESNAAFDAEIQRRLAGANEKTATAVKQALGVEAPPVKREAFETPVIGGEPAAVTAPLTQPAQPRMLETDAALPPRGEIVPVPSGAVRESQVLTPPVSPKPEISPVSENVVPSESYPPARPPKLAVEKPAPVDLRGEFPVARGIQKRGLSVEEAEAGLLETVESGGMGPLERLQAEQAAARSGNKREAFKPITIDAPMRFSRLNQSQPPPQAQAPISTPAIEGVTRNIRENPGGGQVSYAAKAPTLNRNAIGETAQKENPAISENPKIENSERMTPDEYQQMRAAQARFNSASSDAQRATAKAEHSKVMSDYFARVDATKNKPNEISSEVPAPVSAPVETVGHPGPVAGESAIRLGGESGAKPSGQAVAAKPPELMTPGEFRTEKWKGSNFGIPKERVYKDADATNHKAALYDAIDAKRPISAASVDSYKIKSELPEGYTRQGDAYVYQPKAEVKNTPGTQLSSGIDPMLAVEAGKRVVGAAKDGFRKEATEWVSQMAEMAGTQPSFKKTGEFVKSTMKTASDLAKATFYSNQQRLRDIGKRVPIVNKIADKLEPAAGTGKGTVEGLGYHQAVETQTIKFKNEIFKIDEMLKPQRELLGPKERLEYMDHIGREVRNPNAPLTGVKGEVVKSARKMMRDMLEYQREAGVEIGDWGETYFSRPIDFQKVIADQSGFLRQATETYKASGAPPDKAAQLARSYLDSVLLEFHGVKKTATELTTGDTRSVAPSNIKPRSFGEAADRLLSDYYHNNVVDGLQQYAIRAVRRAETARRFGDRLSKWESIKEKIIEQGGAADVNTVADVLRSQIGGVRHFGSAPVRAVANTARAYSSMGLLTYAPVSSIPEFVNTVIRTGKLTDFFPATTKSVANLFRFAGRSAGLEIQKSAAEVTAERLGLVMETINQASVNTKWTADAPGSKGWDRLIAQFHMRTGLNAWTDAVRIMSTEIGEIHLQGLAKDAVKPNAFTKHSIQSLNELGIRNHAEFAKFVESLKDNPDLKWGDSPMAQTYRDAIIRFTKDASIQPNAGHRPTWSTHPIGSVVYSLQSYLWAFQQRVLNRALKQAWSAVTEKDLSYADRAARVTPLFAIAAILAPVTFGVNEMRRMILADPGRNPQPMTPQQKALEVASRAGLFGKYDSFLNMVMGGIKFQRDPATVLLGPALGKAAETFSSAVQVAVGEHNSPNTNTAERKLARNLYDVGVKFPLNTLAAGVPVTRFGNVVGGTAIQAVSHPATREGFVQNMAGAPRFSGLDSGRPQRPARPTRPRRSSR